MIRRYNINTDNQSAWAHFLIYGIYGSGSIHIDIGWTLTAVQISPARILK